MTLSTARNFLLAAMALTYFPAPTMAGTDFVYTGSLRNARHFHTANLLYSGRVLVASGQVTTSTGSRTIVESELFNPVTGSWSLTGPMVESRKFHTATLLTNGFVLAVGGARLDPDLPPDEVEPTTDTCEIYSTAINSWIPAAPLADPRQMHTATRLLNGTVLVTGGVDLAASVIYRSSEIYIPDTNTWLPGGILTGGRFGHTATLLADGRVVVTGGAGTGLAKLKSVEIFDPFTGLWTAGPNMLSARVYHTATLLNNGKILLAGGDGESGPVTTCETLDLTDTRWRTAGTINARQRHTATLMPDGRVLITGGSATTGAWLATSQIYDPELNKWTVDATMNQPRLGSTATLLPSGRVLVAAGFNANSSSSAELYQADLTPYQAWKETSFGVAATDPAVSGDLADPDGDGVSNLMEYVLTGDPVVASAGILPAVNATAEALEISFTRRAPADAVIVVQASLDLAVWTDIAILPASGEVWEGSATVTETGEGATRSVTVSQLISQETTPAYYLRLAVRPT